MRNQHETNIDDDSKVNQPKEASVRKITHKNFYLAKAQIKPLTSDDNSPVCEIVKDSSELDILKQEFESSKQNKCKFLYFL